MRLRRHISLVLLSVGIVALAANVYGGPPFVTDDPEPVEYRHWEFYIASQDSDYEADWSGTAPHFEINYGVITNVQLHLIVPLAYDVPPAGVSHYGIGDVETGAKIRFLNETHWLPEAAVFPLLEIPDGGAKDNLGNPHLQAFLPLWMQKTWGTWNVYGGCGYGLNSFAGRQNWGFGGMVLQKQIFDNFAVGAEIYHQTTYETDFPNQGTAFNVGMIYDLNDHNHLLFSAGRSISGGVRFQCYLAWQWTFDNSVFNFLNFRGN
jgi:hypothetical protein